MKSSLSDGIEMQAVVARVNIYILYFCLLIFAQMFVYYVQYSLSFLKEHLGDHCISVHKTFFFIYYYTIMSIHYNLYKQYSIDGCLGGY